MTDADLRIYFSFRSPFSWFAFHRITSTGVLDWNQVDAVPIFPFGKGANLSAGRAKSSYIRQDAERIAREYALPINWPEGGDNPDWFPPHQIYVWAREQGKAVDYAREAFAARFSRGLDLATDEVMRAAAEAAGLDGEEALAVAHDPKWKNAVMQGFAHTRGDGAFGVPMFIYRGERFWGNDRLDWLLRAMSRAEGRDQPDLAADSLAPVFVPQDRQA